VFSEEVKNDNPTIIIADTIKGKGVSFMEDQPKWHYRMPNKKELAILMNERNITNEELEECRKPA
jgi:transketolase